jgi:putative membrane protein
LNTLVNKKGLNKDLILREEMALERTKMAQYRTFLSFVRSALYFPVAGITMHQAMDISFGLHLQWGGIILGLLILLAGVAFYINSEKKIKKYGTFIGNYPLEIDDDE